MRGCDLEGSGIDMYTEFVFDECLIGVKYLGVIRLILLFLFLDDFPYKFLRFAFPLHKCQDMVDIVRNNVPFVNEVYLLYFTFFGNYKNFFILSENTLLSCHFLVLLNF